MGTLKQDAALAGCRYCELELPGAALLRHEDGCGARTERCKGCGKYVQLRHLQFHYACDHRFLTPEEQDKSYGSDASEEGGEECPVCLSSITMPIALECGHVFCMVCVKGIANTTKNCAICRRDIPRDMLMDIRFCREEDVIKNYVNKPRENKKSTFRSQSVPGRGTTQHYDDMVSHLLSSRTNSTPYRYQRPSNTHTPATYTPYSYTPTTSTHNTTTVSRNSEDDCCCQSTDSTTQPAVTSANNGSSVPTSSISPVVSSVASTSALSNLHVAASNISSSRSSNPFETRPRRPTSLALRRSSDLEEPTQRSTQEQEDRALAFQLARTDEDDYAAEVLRKYKPALGRSLSVPETEIAAMAQQMTESNDTALRSNSESSSSESTSSDDDDDDENSKINNVKSSGPRNFSRPPASPRTSAISSSLISVTTVSSSTNPASNTSPSNTSRASTSSRSPSLTKSSSDSNASTSSNTSSSGGARPKCPTTLKKRVSFKEDEPRERRVAPIMLPCEFCDEMFPERDLMRHQTSCDLNETQMPRSRRHSLTPSLTSPTRSLNSPSSSTRNTTSSAPNSNLASPVSPAGRRKVPPNLPLGSSKRSDTPRSTTSDTSGSSPNSPSVKMDSFTPPGHSSNRRFPSSLKASQRSPQSSLSDNAYSSSDSRPTSISPCPPHSINSSSSGVSSMASTNRSVSNTPSNSSSASPIPAVVDTSTDIDADFTDEDAPYVKPRRGKLLSSAICSWRSMSNSGNDRAEYTRSSTCPLEDRGDSIIDGNPILPSSSASQLPPLPPRPESTPIEASQSSNERSSSRSHNHRDKSHNKTKGHNIFIKRPKKYKAPLPPSAKQASESRAENIDSSGNEAPKIETNDRTVFRLDSKPMMNNRPTTPILEACEFCQRTFTKDQLSSHKSECEDIPEHYRWSFREPVRQRAPSVDPAPSTSTPSEEVQSHADSQVPPRRFERAQSVLDERCVVNRGRRVERRSSFIEGSRPGAFEPLSRRWSSRETLSNYRGDSTSPSSSNSSFAGVATTQNKHSSRNWSDHVSMVQDGAKAKVNSAKALIYGHSRYRSSSMSRPSLYSSSCYTSTTRLNSLDGTAPSRPSEAFGPSFRRRYVR